MKTAPSLLACDFLHLADEVKRAEAAGSDWLHCDVMDGVYVPNISFGFDIIGKIHTITDLPLDVHMMTAVPEKYLEVLAKAGAYSVTIHSDVMEKEKLMDTLEKIHELGMKTGVALKPKCPADDLTPYLALCDMALVMTVEPGFGGQKFISYSLDKIRRLKDMAKAMHREDLDIEVDGGVTPDNILALGEAGVTISVAGSSVFGKPDRKAAIEALRKR